MDKKLEELKKHYNDVPIPKELDFVVESALKQGKRKKKIEDRNGYLEQRQLLCYLQLV